jgi:membrane-associated phospholipid phosphatase
MLALSAPIAVKADGPIMLSASLPSMAHGAASATVTDDKPQVTNILTGQVGDKNAYNAQLIGLAALVASDDAGLQKTLTAKPGSSMHNFAENVTKAGDLKYAAPALALVYLAGGDGNKRLAEHATIAALKAGAVGLVLKYAAGRQRPYAGKSNGTSFKPGSNEDGYNSFPSGHTIVAFSVASVWAHEKPKERYIAYGLASLVGLSRIGLSAHWPTDVLAGAALGLAQGRQVNNGNTGLFSLRF